MTEGSLSLAGVLRKRTLFHHNNVVASQFRQRQRKISSVALKRNRFARRNIDTLLDRCLCFDSQILARDRNDLLNRAGLVERTVDQMDYAMAVSAPGHRQFDRIWKVCDDRHPVLGKPLQAFFEKVTIFKESSYTTVIGFSY